MASNPATAVLFTAKLRPFRFETTGLENELHHTLTEQDHDILYVVVGGAENDDPYGLSFA